MLTFIDSHSHLTDSKYDEVRNELIESLEADGIKSAFTVGYDFESSKMAVELANKYPNIYAIIGVHPDDIECYNMEVERFLIKESKNPKVLAIGEIGIDYHSFNSSDDIEKIKLKQKEVFEKQLKVADSMGLPVVIHTRDSIDDALTILENNKNLLNNGGIIHCFLNGENEYKRIKKLGFKISIGGILTFKNGKNLQNAVKDIDINDILLETDCPYLTPEPYRGKVINEPKFVSYVAQKISELKNIPIDEVSRITSNNVKSVFKKYKD